MHEGAGYSFLRGASVKLSVMLLHRHRAVWYEFKVGWLNSRGVGLF